MEIPTQIERAVDTAVAHHLQMELSRRGLLLTADGLAASDAEVARLGTQLMTGVIRQCYLSAGRSGVALQFESERDAARINGALAFGGVTARVLMPAGRSKQFVDSVELICAAFNLGIGLIDGLCDNDAETGGALIWLIERQDLTMVAEKPMSRGWLRATLPTTLARNPTVSFTVDIIEVFFEMFHALYSQSPWLQIRHYVGGLLGAAFLAERQSVLRLADQIGGEQLVECSRLTSVLPFQIIETLACGKYELTEPTAGTLLGEAMWRIDDLVDLCQDARNGALNGVLLSTATGKGHPKELSVLNALGTLLASTDIPRFAGDAADRLLAGLQLASGFDTPANHTHCALFLSFIQRYAGIAPVPFS